MIPPGFAVVGYGFDDLTLGFDMTGSGSIARLNERSGRETARGKMLGETTMWSKWSHLLGSSVSFWKPDTNRLYVQAKLAQEGELCPPSEVGREVQALIERMAIVGLESYEEPWVTRADIAVDAECAPAEGKRLLDALEAVRLPNGWRTMSVGTPRSTVYFRARGSERVLARAYCRNLKTKQGEPFGRIRLEAEQRFKPKECPLSLMEQPAFAEMIWSSRYGNLVGTVTRLPRETQDMAIAERVQWGELTCQEGERLSMFLSLEGIGLAQAFYGKRFAMRRREVAKLGYAANEAGTIPVKIELGELLAPYRRAVETGIAA